MHNYTRDDIFHIVEEEDVAFIRLQFTDIFGTMKNMAVTVGQLEKALDNRCMFDVSSLEGVADEEESDMYLYPDLSTFEIFPWRPQQGKVARLICDVYKKDGTPYEGDPRYVLRKAVAEAKEMGYTMNVGPECEFFLFHTDDDGRPTTVTHEQGGYFDVGPLDLGENARHLRWLSRQSQNDTVCTRHLCQSRRVRLMGQECTLICLYIKTMEQMHFITQRMRTDSVRKDIILLVA